MYIYIYTPHNKRGFKLKNLQTKILKPLIISLIITQYNHFFPSPTFISWLVIDSLRRNCAVAFHFDRQRSHRGHLTVIDCHHRVHRNSAFPSTMKTRKLNSRLLHVQNGHDPISHGNTIFNITQKWCV